ncbi:MAG: hypothetical protein GBAus27B_000027 [Mycoplasmataceae bacterium]|nr:MAG: hypothetical protein GBAus27B_000027 [Mycoplasmataceae bacterium]
MCWKDCSRYIKRLDRNLIELLPIDLSPVVENENLIYHYPKLPQSMAELLGDEGEEKVFEILNSSRKIKFKKLIKNWQEIDDLQIDIYAETKDKVYFVEVKNWSGTFFYSPDEFSQRQEKIWQQQVNRQQKISENFDCSKQIIYLISFPSGELAHDFQKFINQKESKEVIVSHHDTVHDKAWKVEYDVNRIDELTLLKKRKLS